MRSRRGNYPVLDSRPLGVVDRGDRRVGLVSDWLGRLRFACWDDGREELREVGWMFSGLTDAELREITQKLEPLVESVDGRTADLRPEVVIEVESEEIQASTTYDSGYALRSRGSAASATTSPRGRGHVRARRTPLRGAMR